MDLKIRKAVAEDIPFVLDLFVQIENDKREVLSVIEANEIFNKFKNYPDYTLYVAEYGKKIVAAFELLIMDNLAHKGRPSGIVEDVVVDGDYRSRGIGKKMMEYAISKCKEAGCYKLSLSSNINRERAHSFYEKLGFKKHGFSFLIEL